MRHADRLTRDQVIARLQAHAKRFGVVTTASLQKHDRGVWLSFPAFFPSLDAARYVARVPSPPHPTRGRKRGPKPGTNMPFRRTVAERRREVIAELRALHRAGRSTSWRDLMARGRAGLITRTYELLGGLRRARRVAGIPTPPREKPPGRVVWSRKKVLSAIEARRRRGHTLAPSRVPPVLYNAARRRFGSWRRAVTAAGLDPDRVRRPPGGRHTREQIVEQLRRAVKATGDSRSDALRSRVNMKGVQREFGTLREALVAAGLGGYLEIRRTGQRKWSQQRVIEVLRERWRRGEYRMTRALYRVVGTYFAGTEDARRAAGVPSPRDLSADARRRLARGETIRPRRRKIRRLESVRRGER